VDESIEQVSAKLIEHGINHMPIVDSQGRLVGIVTSWDIARAVAQGIKELDKIMTRQVITATEDELLEEAARKMASHDISGLPVVDAYGRVVGIITTDDVSRFMGGM